MKQRRASAALVACLLVAGCATAPAREVQSAAVLAHVGFLASDAMRGRGSGTRDEAIAAAYVASQFQAYGLRPAPGLESYLQVAPVPVSEHAQKAGLTAEATTTSAIGFLPGTDPNAGVLLISGHLDHVGSKNGVIFPGANDNASGTTAVLELARLLAATGPHRRGILFAAYGAEELGGVGSRFFATHPPVPLESIIANIGFEMIGVQDPKLPAGTLMMTGFERSNLGVALRARGGLVSPDPYPEEHFFERSDNYQLAKVGIVAHTISGWAMAPTYHQRTDTVGNLDIAFMTRAIQSLVAPITSLANSDFRPQWTEGGRPKAD